MLVELSTQAKSCLSQYGILRDSTPAATMYSPISPQTHVATRTNLSGNPVYQELRLFVPSGTNLFPFAWLDFDPVRKTEGRLAAVGALNHI